MAFSAKFILISQWFDRRLTYQNLHEDEFLNEIEYGQVGNLWVPTLIFDNTQDKFTTPVDKKSKLFVRKKGNSTFSPDTNSEEIAYFKGSENVLSYSRDFYLRFKCHFELHFYPFDSQVCSMIIKKQSWEFDFVKIHPESVVFRGSEDVEDFSIEKIDMISEKEAGGSTEVRIFLKRRVSQHLLYTYLPSLCLLMIAQVRGRRRDIHCITKIHFYLMIT